MESKKQVIIEQTLHGYDNGHALLANSCELNVAERRALLFMSDLSGPLLNKKFETYLTGYAIPGSHFYVFARTWYAFEMSRPGCAWTHSLLIDISQLGRISEFEQLNSLFCRPEINSIDHFKNYMTQIELESHDVLSNDIFLDTSIKGLQELFVNLYSLANISIASTADSPTEYEPAILEIWKYQWPRLRRNFTFCSGSLNLRESNGKYLDLQILQNGRKVNTSKSEKLIFISKDPSTWLNVNPIPKSIYFWSKEMQTHFFRFMHRFGSDIEGSRSQLTSLGVAFDYWNNKLVSDSIFDLIQFLDSEFPEPDQARLLKTDFIIFKLQRNSESKYEFLLAMHKTDTPRAFSGVRWNVRQILQEVLDDSLVSDNKKRRLLEVCNEETILQVLPTYINSLPFSVWYDLERLAVNWLVKIVEDFPNIIFQTELWTGDKKAQDRWLTAMERGKTTDWKAFFRFYLTTGEYNQIPRVLEKVKDLWTAILLDWCAEKKLDSLPDWWIVFFSKQPDIFFNALSDFENHPEFCYRILTKYPPVILLEVGLKNVSMPHITSYWLHVNNEKGRVEILIWLFSAALKNLLENSDDVATAIISPLTLEISTEVDSVSKNFLTNYNHYIKPDFESKLDIWKFLLPSSSSKTMRLTKNEELIAFFVTGIIENGWSALMVDKAFPDDDLFTIAIKYCLGIRESLTILAELNNHYADHKSAKAKLFNKIINQANKLL